MNNTERVTTVISYMASLDLPKGLTKIAKELNLNKATTYRLLRSLEKNNG